MIYIGFTLLCLLCVAFIALPVLYRTHSGNLPIHKRALAASFKSRLEEVQSEISEPGIAKELETELGLNLIDESASLPDHLPLAPPPTKRHILAIVAGSLLIPCFAFLLYHTVGKPDISELRDTEAVLALTADSDRGKLELWQAFLSEQTANEPADARSWYLLGHANFKLQQYDLAASSFARAQSLSQQFPDTQLMWLQAHYLAAGRKLNSTSRHIARQILSSNPTQAQVLEMLSLDALQQGRTSESLTLMQRALASTASATERKSLHAAIRQIEGMM